MRTVIAAVVGAACALRGGAARAQDRFEIQVYDTDTAPRGGTGLELHLNQTSLRGAPDETHLTFEPHLGLADWAELGGYLQTAIDTSGSGGFAGAKVRVKLRLPHRVWDDRVGLALNGELSGVPARYEAQVWASELRPAIDLQAGALYASVNPIVGVDLAGADAGYPQLEPAGKLAWRATPTLAFGVEGYLALGPVNHLGDETITRALAVVDVRGHGWDLNAGLGPAWGSADRFVAKLIFGVDFGH